MEPSKFFSILTETLSGLSLDEAETLLNDPWGPDSIVQLNRSALTASANNNPLFDVVWNLMAILNRTGRIKLTPTLQMLPKVVVTELFDMCTIPNEDADLFKPVMSEDKLLHIEAARYVAQFAGLVSVRNRTIGLSSIGEKLFTRMKRAEAYERFLRAYFDKYNWGSRDYYVRVPVAMHGWAISIYLLGTYGDEARPASFYSEKYWLIFPHYTEMFHSEFRSPKEVFQQMYELRTFQRGFNWMGWVNASQERPGHGIESMVEPTRHLFELFTVRPSLRIE